MRFVCNNGCRLFPTYGVRWGGYADYMDFLDFTFYRDLSFQHTLYYRLVIAGIGLLAPLLSVGVALQWHRKLQPLFEVQRLELRRPWMRMDTQWLM